MVMIPVQCGRGGWVNSRSTLAKAMAIVGVAVMLSLAACSSKKPAPINGGENNPGGSQLGENGVGKGGGNSLEDWKNGKFGAQGPLSDIHFAYNEYTIQEQDGSVLKSNASWLQAHPQTRVQVEGHCDERGSEEYNIALVAEPARSLCGKRIRIRSVRKTNWPIGAAAVFAAAVALAGCAEQGDVQQLNQNEFTLRGMIASDRQQINSLKQQIQRQNDQIEELKHGAAGAGGNASSMNDRVASLEAEVKALQAGMAATPGAPADSVGEAPAPAIAPPGGPVAPATPAAIPPTWPNELDQEIADAKTSSEPGVKIYREGLDAMKAGKYPLAVTRFTKLQHAYPKSALSEPAEYFAANALFETGGYD